VLPMHCGIIYATNRVWIVINDGDIFSDSEMHIHRLCNATRSLDDIYATGSFNSMLDTASIAVFSFRITACTTLDNISTASLPAK